MPWREVPGGYTKAHERRGGFIRNPRQYEKLRRMGMSKPRAAAITNSDNIGKAFDPERQRHRRQVAYEAGATSAAVTAAGGAGAAQRAARKHLTASRMATERANQARGARNHYLGTLRHDPMSDQRAFRRTVADKAHAAASRVDAHTASASEEAVRAFKLAQRSRRLGLAAGVAAGGAYGVHRFDRHPGQSYR